jgi:hypothetical protein
MPRFANISLLLRRVGGQGAFDNVTAVLEARAQAHEQVDTLAARVQQAA